MKREKQYDMFDVATGACSFEDYLVQRHNENDLTTTFWIDEKDEVDELRPPAPTEDGQPGKDPVLIPIQGPRAQTAQRAGPPPVPTGLESEEPAKSNILPSSSPPSATLADGRDTLASPQQPGPPSLETVQMREGTLPLAGGDSFQAQEVEAPPEGPSSLTPVPPSMEDLLARFHQATREYQERTQQEGSVEGPEETTT